MQYSQNTLVIRLRYPVLVSLYDSTNYELAFAHARVCVEKVFLAATTFPIHVTMQLVFLQFSAVSVLTIRSWIEAEVYE